MFATMQIIHQEKNGIVCLIVKGRMEAQLSPDLERAIKEIIAGGKSRLLTDFSALDYIQTSVLRVKLNAIKAINQIRGSVVLFCLSGYAKEIFEVNRFKDIITITDSVKFGLKELSCGLKAPGLKI